MLCESVSTTRIELILMRLHFVLFFSHFPCDHSPKIIQWTDGQRNCENKKISGQTNNHNICHETRLFLQSPANPDLLYIIIFCHTQLTVTLLLALIFGSKVSTNISTGRNQICFHFTFRFSNCFKRIVCVFFL